MLAVVAGDRITPDPLLFVVYVGIPVLVGATVLALVRVWRQRHR